MAMTRKPRLRKRPRGRLRKSDAALQNALAACNRQLREAIQQQAATASVLKTISRTRFNLQTVLDTLCEAAARLCVADHAWIYRRDGDSYRWAASYGHSKVDHERIKEFMLAQRIKPGRGTLIGRTALEGRPVQFADALSDPEYTWSAAQQVGKYRTTFGTPLLREGDTIGVLALTRSEVKPFTDREVELATNFADQALIAIENARLFTELQDKTNLLEITDKYKSHFLASASHDLRQPLHALNLFVAQLHTETDPAERRELVGRIEAAVVSMNELFDSLLDMSKLEAGILDPHLGSFPIERVFSRLEATFADAARLKMLRFAVVPSNAWVHSDFILLERILMNLVSNAVRYTMQGGVVVGCRRRGEHIRIDVCDSGAGIPKDQQQTIFEEYYQLAAAEPDRGGGIGLGLAIVDRLGRLLDHDLELDSRPGRGSRFSVLVPLAADRTDAVEAAMSLANIDPAQGKLVVVIDDDPIVLKGMGGILRSWHCEVVAAESAEEALQGVIGLGRLPDLIVADYRLAGNQTGTEAVKRIRGALGDSIPAFLISGDTAPERLRDASANGFYLLHKPVPPMRLRAVLHRLLKSPNGAVTDTKNEATII
jgi:signal transduction histidine kinase/CheY-like chemotaxis protein